MVMHMGRVGFCVAFLWYSVEPISLMISLWGLGQAYIWYNNEKLSGTKPCAYILFLYKPQPHTVYPKKYAHGFCFAVLCCGYTLTDCPISIRLTSLALWQSNDCPSASKATLMNMDKYFIWIHYERLHNHNKAKHIKTVCIFLGIHCSSITITRGVFNCD